MSMIQTQKTEICRNCADNYCCHGACKELVEGKMVKFPCRNCVYFNTCGDNMRTRPCKGRKTRNDIKKECEQL